MEQHHSWGGRAIILAAVVALALGVTGAACKNGDGSSDDEEAIRDLINQAAAAWNASDADTYFALHTEDGIKADLADAEDQSPEGLREAFLLYSSEDHFGPFEVSNISVDGDTATADLVTSFVPATGDPPPSTFLVAVRGSMIKDGDDWKFDGQEFIPPDIPDGVTTVQLDAAEFSFTFDAAQASSGNVAFAMANVGAQQHHVTLEQVPEDLDIEEALQSEEEPEGLVHIGSTPPLDPGDTINIVLTAGLSPGRYVLLCFLPDTDGTPHALKGMWKDFTVE